MASRISQSVPHSMKELAALFEEAGLSDVSYHPFTGGVAATHIGKKL